MSLTVNIIAIFVTFFFCAVSIAADDTLESVLQSLEKRYASKTAPASPDGVLRLPTSGELDAIQTECGFVFPSPLRQLYERVGDRGFLGIELVRAHGGKDSQLCALIRKYGHADEYIRFFADGGGHYGMHKDTLKVHFIPDVTSEGEEIYPSLSAFLERKFLATN